MTTADQATVRLHAAARIKVEPFIRLTGSTHIHVLHATTISAPILAIDDGNVSVSLTVPDVQSRDRRGREPGHGAG